MFLGEVGLWVLWGRGDVEVVRVLVLVLDGVSFVSLVRSFRGFFSFCVFRYLERSSLCRALL